MFESVTPTFIIEKTKIITKGTQEASDSDAGSERRQQLSPTRSIQWLKHSSTYKKILYLNQRR